MQRGPSAKRAQSSHYVFQDVEGKADLSGKGQGPTPTRKRAKRTALTVGLAVVAFLVLGFMMYISQSYLDARSALLEERFLMQQKIKQSKAPRAYPQMNLAQACGNKSSGNMTAVIVQSPLNQSPQMVFKKR